MAFGIYSLLEAALLCINAIAILNEERFLNKVGWGSEQNVGGFGEEPGMKTQIISLIKSIRIVMRVPLIFLNAATIIVKLLLG
ncbi:immediate early response 3-interacting protein 1-like [Diadema setosum]|uniref:immediate early response 3-interacting protein 1-like n=1 Tax=Diadema antillarum TaxID=105358 RepID=UPI003A875333